MISHHGEKSGSVRHNLLKLLGAVATVSAFSVTPLLAADGTELGYSYSGELDTVFRMRSTIDKRKLFPIYEYVRLNMTDNRSDGSVTSFYLGGWGRVDLADKTDGKYTDADLQYAYLSYRDVKNNAVVSLGRQFVTEGVAAERLDGLYLHSDFMGGFGAAVYAGQPVITETHYQGGNLVYGGRVSQTDNKYYTAGLSALISEQEGDGRYREEQGLDLWLHPMEQVDLTGRSTYNSLTNGWMEHAYALSVVPLDKIRVSADFSHINYYDYFYNMTTSTLSFTNSMIDPNEKMTSGGVAVSYLPVKNLTVIANYKLYEYDIAKSANYYGGKVTYSLPQSYAAGLSINRMDGKTDRIRYTEYRAYASKKIGKADISLDLIDIYYDAPVNGVKNSYAVTGSAGYEFNKKVKVGANMEYLKSPDFDNELRAMLKVTYSFDSKRGEGEGKNEK
ncbi:MAG: hypothetical protein ACYDHC_11490 [Desulfuromonadaceae bacterium]